MTRRALLAGSATLAAGIACAGCAATSASTGASEGAAKSEAQPSSEAQPEPTLLTGASAYASTNYSPIGLNGGASLTMAATRHVFEGLYDLDLRTFAPYPALAEGELVQISDTEYEVSLRANARYSDGTPVTTADVANAFVKNKDNPTMGFLLEAIADISAKDERTMSISLNHPLPELLASRLALVKVYPVNREAELDTLPIGSGPWAYVADKLNGEKSIEFIPNSHYNGPLPAEADGMSWTIIAADGTRTTALRDHAVQVAEDIPTRDDEQLQRTGAKVKFVQGFSQPFLMFNTLKRPFSDKRVRQAILYAIDVQALIDERMGGHAQPLTSFLPKSHAHYHRASTVYKYDPLRAKALLAAAGVHDLAFTLIANKNWVAELAPAIVDNLADCGITCTVKEEALRWNEFADTGRVLPYDVVLAAGDPSRFGNDPDLLLSWWYGDNEWTRGRSCWARDENGSFAEMQELLQAARRASGDERQALWNECFDLIADEVPLYGLFHREIATGWQPERINGFVPIATSGLDFLGCIPA